MQIKKRNGTIVDYDGSKIVLAIKMALIDAKVEDTEMVEDIIDNIENDILEEMEDSDYIFNVEDISDRVEQLLMKYGLGNIAKKYILFRNKQAERRELEANETIKYNLLSKDFLNKYKHIKPPMTELGNLVYYRTYSRWISEKKRREYWWETCARAIDFNCSLQPRTTQKEAESLFDNMFNLRQFLSGRTLWSGGTATSYTNPISQFNCAFAVIDNFNIYKDFCYLLMLGVGVGFSVEREYVNQLPKISGSIKLNQLYYTPILNKSKRKENTEFNVVADVLEIIVGDSKMGWANAIDYFLKAFYAIDFKNINHIMINYNNVRPKGEPLKTFGGTASGHEALKTIIDKTYAILIKNNEGYKKLKPIEAMDIANIIAEGIVVGGVRRSAEMCLFDHDDKEVMEAKSNLYIQENGEWKSNGEILHRMMSNNSVSYYTKPSLEDLKLRFETIKLSAEGNFYNLASARLRKRNVKGCNPSMPKDVLVQTIEGIFHINELEGKEFYVKTLNGDIAKAECWLSSDNAEVFDLDFKGNRHTYATSKHKFPVIQNGKIVRKQVSELQKGDKIPLNRNELQGYSKKLSYQDGLFAGIMLGDGSITQRSDDNRYVASLTISDLDLELKSFVDKHYYSMTGLTLTWNRRNKEDKSQETNFGRQDFVYDYLIKILGLPLSKEGKRLPIKIWTEGDNYCLGFIDGLFSTDGNIDVDKNRKSIRVQLTTSQQLLAEDVQKLLSFYGISANIKSCERKITFPNGKDYEKLYTIYGVYLSKSQSKRFNNIFTLTAKRKQEYIDDFMSENDIVDRNYIVLNTITKRSEEPVWDITVLHEQHVFPSQHCYTGNCGEILLDSEQFCNLTTVNVMAFVINGKLDKELLYEAQKLSARAGYRIATMELELPEWNYMQSRDRLIGCSFTGWFDMVNATDMSLEEQTEVLKEMRKVANDEANQYADDLGLNRPELVTSIKPEGTLSQLPTVSSGLHFQHSRYYIRRIRINSSDPLVKVCEELGYPIFPEVGQNIETCGTKVIEFPVESPKGRTKYDVSAIEQLEIYKMVMKNYVDHNASNTIHVRPNEWNGVIEWVYNNWDIIIGITFISLDNSFFQLLPYEAITEEEYEIRRSKMKEFNPELLQKYEIREEEHELDNSECTTGVCPVR